MGFFRKEKNKKQGRIRKTLIVTSAMLLFISFAPAVVNNTVVDRAFGIETAYAATATQSWKQDASTGAWKVYDSATGQYLASQWYQDTDGSWYLLKADTNMAEGLYQDVDGSWYYLNEKHDGTYGRLMTTGTYNGVYIQTNEQHDGTWGRILNLEVLDGLKGAIGGGATGGAAKGQAPKQNNQGRPELPPGFEYGPPTMCTPDGTADISQETLDNIKNATYY